MDLLKLVLSSTLIAGVVTALLNLIFKSQIERIANEIRIQSEQISIIFKSQYTWKEQSLSELLAPINMLLYRTQKAFDRLTANNEFIEAKILRESNEKIRDLLLQKGHLIPDELIEDANALIEHYDRWLEEFEEVRIKRKQNPDKSFPFTFTGPKGYPFPRESADNFQEKFKAMWMDVYGQNKKKL